MSDISNIYYPTLDQIKSALFIQPHPDDNEIGAGGTIAILRKKGVKVYGLTVTEGRGGSNDPSITPEKLGEIRKLEAAEAMRRLDVIDLGNLGYHDLKPIVHEQLVEEVVKVLRDIKVDAIFTVDPQLKNELHPVHIQTGKAVSEAYMRCNQKYYPYHDQKIHDDAYLLKMIGYYFTDDETTIVDISNVIDQKMYAMAAHKTQMNDHSLQMFQGLFQANAQGCDFTYAERLKLLNDMHTHCFAVPKEVLKNLPITIFK